MLHSSHWWVMVILKLSIVIFIIVQKFNTRENKGSSNQFGFLWFSNSLISIRRINKIEKLRRECVPVDLYLTWILREDCKNTRRIYEEKTKLPLINMLTLPPLYRGQLSLYSTLPYHGHWPTYIKPSSHHINIVDRYSFLGYMLPT